jgi:hypothetical protein
MKRFLLRRFKHFLLLSIQRDQKAGKNGSSGRSTIRDAIRESVASTAIHQDTFCVFPYQNLADLQSNILSGNPEQWRNRFVLCHNTRTRLFNFVRIVHTILHGQSICDTGSAEVYTSTATRETLIDKTAVEVNQQTAFVS